jgi:type IV secretory pathway VirJ component
VRHRLFRIGLAAVLAATASAVWWFRPQPLPDTDTLVVADLVRPSGPPQGIVFLFSGYSGYGAADAVTARQLAGKGAYVVGVDLRKTFAKAAVADGDGEDACVYFVSDVEMLSQVIQRSAGAESYLSPILAGTDTGGSMVLAMAAQSPLATIGHFVAVDPTADLPFAKELCSGGPHLRTADGKGWVYGMQPGQLPAPVTVVETPQADPAGHARVSDLIAKGFAVDQVTVSEDRERALPVALSEALTQSTSPGGEGLADLPLAVLPAPARHDTMAIVLSGDGGWRDIDRQLGDALAKDGVPTVGLDSLRYFWTRKPPETLAADLARLVDHYTKAWNVHHVALIGYSFGADALPAAYNQLPAADRQRVSLVSLLALGRWATFEFEVGGWLGMEGDTSRQTLPDVKKIPVAVLQCIYGTDDDDSICDQLNSSGAQVVTMDGDHHFDNDYAALASHIIARIKQASAMATSGQQFAQR